MALNERDYMRDDVPTLTERLRNVSAFHWFFGANIAVFLAQFVFGWGASTVGRQFIPGGGVSIEELSEGRIWTPFTYMFVHGSVGHILLNMMMLWFAGKRVQELYGPRHFMGLYILAGLVGAALQIVVGYFIARQPDAYLLGASASIMGLMLAYAVAMPEEEIHLLLFFILPVRFRMWGLAKFLLISNLAFGLLGLVHVLPEWLSGGGAPIAYLAHFGGAVAGWYYARHLGYGSLPFQLGGLGASLNPRPKRRHPVLAGKHSRPLIELNEPNKRSDSPETAMDLMRDEVDPILDKISELGLNSLTDEERRILERASRQIGRNI